MKFGVEVKGPSVILFGKDNWPPMSRFVADNDATSCLSREEDARTVTVRRQLEKSGVQVKVKVPVSEYFGVSVSTTITEEGVLSSIIHLVHEDEGLNYKVFEEEGNQNVVAEWQNWGKALRLPLFIRSGDGKLVPYSQQVDGVLLGRSNARRKTAGEAERRPRFLNRRQTGMNLVG